MAVILSSHCYPTWHKINVDDSKSASEDSYHDFNYKRLNPALCWQMWTYMLPMSCCCFTFWVVVGSPIIIQYFQKSSQQCLQTILQQLIWFMFNYCGIHLVDISLNTRCLWMTVSEDPLDIHQFHIYLYKSDRIYDVKWWMCASVDFQPSYRNIIYHSESLGHRSWQSIPFQYCRPFIDKFQHWNPPRND
jgi:hypothetical protein